MTQELEPRQITEIEYGVPTRLWSEEALRGGMEAIGEEDLFGQYSLNGNEGIIATREFSLEGSNVRVQLEVERPTDLEGDDIYAPFPSETRVVAHYQHDGRLTADEAPLELEVVGRSPNMRLGFSLQLEGVSGQIQGSFASNEGKDPIDGACGVIDPGTGDLKRLVLPSDAARLSTLAITFHKGN